MKTYLCTTEKDRLRLDNDDLDDVQAANPAAAAKMFVLQMIREGEELGRRCWVRRPTEDEWMVFRVTRPITVTDTGRRFLAKVTPQ